MPRLSESQLDRALQNLSGWNPTERDIRKEYQFADFIEAMSFVNEVAQLAEEVGHHPDIEIRYNVVVLTLWTREEDGVTERDVRLAREIEEIWK